MRTNTKIQSEPLYTHEGARAARMTPEQQLRRSVMACMLWERSFYESGEDITHRIRDLVTAVKPDKVAQIAIEARELMKLRHVPLFLVRELARKNQGALVRDTLARVIQRADELAEFVALYWKDDPKDKRQSLSASVKKGLAKAFQKFDAYQLEKYNRDTEIKLRDVMFLCRPKPKDEAQAAVWKQLADKTLPVPDTWEVALSTGKDKKATWERLIAENKLGALAVLRNLRNMKEAGVADKVVFGALESMKLERVLPFRFIAAAKHAPQWESQIEQAMFRCVAQQQLLRGKTVLIVDVSGSMFGSGNISKHSDLTRVDAACGLAILAREMCEQPVIYATAGNDGTRIHATKLVPNRRGFALSDAIQNGMRSELGGGGIFLTQCMDYVFEREKEADRVIVLTDEQDCDVKCSPDKANAFGKHNYIVNISIEQNGIAWSKFTHINGWSEAILNYIQASENSQ
jgi:60 kDa SS-A/Ro ribonucleoprotein